MTKAIIILNVRELVTGDNGPEYENNTLYIPANTELVSVKGLMNDKHSNIQIHNGYELRSFPVLESPETVISLFQERDME